MKLPGYWMDIGQPKDYLKGQQLHIKQLIDDANPDGILTSGSNIIGGVIVHPSAQVDESARIGPNVVIGKNCKVGKGVRISNTCILAGTHVDDYACVDGSIIGWDNVIGKWTRIIGLTVTSEDVKFKD